MSFILVAMFVLAVAVWVWSLVGQSSSYEELASPLNPEEYVYVQDDGTARQLMADEVEYLATPFHPADGARPYTKSCYRERTPDGRLSGFLQRRRLPRDVPVRS